MEEIKEMEYYKYLRQYVGHQPLILPGSVVIIMNEGDEVLLQERLNGDWGLPGGLMDLGESFEEVAIREVFEETGLIVKKLKLLNVYSGSKYYLKVANGDELYSITAVFFTHHFSGKLKIDYNESRGMRYFKMHHLPHRLNHHDRDFIQAYESSIMEKNKDR